MALFNNQYAQYTGKNVFYRLMRYCFGLTAIITPHLANLASFNPTKNPVELDRAYQVYLRRLQQCAKQLPTWKCYLLGLTPLIKRARDQAQLYEGNYLH